MMLDSVGKPRLVHKLVQRLLFTESKDVLRSFLRLHGLKMLKFWLLEWAMDMEIVQKVGLRNIWVKWTVEGITISCSILF